MHRHRGCQRLTDVLLPYVIFIVVLRFSLAPNAAAAVLFHTCLIPKDLIATATAVKKCRELSSPLDAHSALSTSNTPVQRTLRPLSLCGNLGDLPPLVEWNAFTVLGTCATGKWYLGALLC